MIVNKNKIITILLLAFVLMSVAPAMAVNEITGLTAVSETTTAINWQWTANDTYYNSSVLIDGVYIETISSPVTGTQAYSGSGFVAGSAHTISINTTDMNGTFSGWVNSTDYTTGSIESQMQPLTDLITWATSNSNLWIGLVILGVMLAVAMAIGVFIKNILNKATKNN